MRGAFVGVGGLGDSPAGPSTTPLKDRMSDPDLSSRPPVMMLVAADNATHFTSALAQTFATEALQVHRFPVSLPLEEIVEGLNRVDGNSLATYSSMLATLAAEAQAGRLRIQPQRIATTAEPLLPEIRRAAQRTWGAPIANVWGTSEGGTTALGCYQDSGMHLCDDLVIVEPVDSSGEPVAPGTPSAKVYLTNLVNPLLPLIRYEITDEVTLLDDPCVCGSAHRRIADIEGRCDDVFVYAGERTVQPYVFKSVPRTRDGRHRVPGPPDPDWRRDTPPHMRAREHHAHRAGPTSRTGTARMPAPGSHNRDRRATPTAQHRQAQALRATQRHAEIPSNPVAATPPDQARVTSLRRGAKPATSLRSSSPRQPLLSPRQSRSLLRLFSRLRSGRQGAAGTAGRIMLAPVDHCGSAAAGAVDDLTGTPSDQIAH